MTTLTDDRNNSIPHGIGGKDTLSLSDGDTISKDYFDFISSKQILPSLRRRNELSIGSFGNIDSFTADTNLLLFT
jgi:hypothetical protein